MYEEQSSISFTTLPDEILCSISQHLSINEVIPLSLTSKRFHSLFSPEVKSAQLLALLFQRNSVKAAALLQSDPFLFCKKISFKDWAGRTFLSISPFQYLLWELEIEFIMDIPNMHLTEDERFFQIMVDQYNSVLESGVSYVLDGKMYTERHYTGKHLFDAYQFYISANYASEEERMRTWCELVGREQIKMPPYIRDWMVCCAIGIRDGRIYKEQTNAHQLLYDIHPKFRWLHWERNNLRTYSKRPPEGILGVNCAILFCNLTSPSQLIGIGDIDSARYDMLKIKYLMERNADLLFNGSVLNCNHFRGLSSRL